MKRKVRNHFKRDFGMTAYELSRGNRLYRTWNNIVYLRTNPKCKWHLTRDDRIKSRPLRDYCYRGGRIDCCKEWRESFAAFAYWAIDNGWREDLTIERIDHHKGYSPANCRWATPREQSLHAARVRRENAALRARGIDPYAW